MGDLNADRAYFDEAGTSSLSDSEYNRVIDDSVENNKRPMRITFKRELFILPWEHASKIIITNVEYIE